LVSPFWYDEPAFVDESGSLGRFARVLIRKRRAGPDSVLVKHRFCEGEEKPFRRRLPWLRRRWAKSAGWGNSCRAKGGKYFHHS
jgi:hypothetical protein